MKPSLLYLTLLLSLTACRAPIASMQTTTREVQVVLRDTVLRIEPDSAAVHALLECDSANQVILRRLQTLDGQRIRPSFLISNNPDGSADVAFVCHEDSLLREILLRDSIITHHSEQVRTIEVPAGLNRWQSFFLVLGYIAGAILLTLIILWICKLLIKR